jgi:uncharacterized protein (DUF983 family)
MLRRGLVRRCPRCGERRIFRTYWSIRDRCPHCGLRFVREEGYFTGVYLLNLTLVIAVLFVMVMVFAVWRGSHPDDSMVAFVVAGVVAAVALPVLGYPFARTTWVALDLIMTPMELDEILDSAEATDEDEEPDRADDPPVAPADPEDERPDGPS